METIKDYIDRMIQQNIPTQIVVGKVISVDENKQVCDVDVVNSPDLLDVRIRAVIDDEKKGVLIVPKVDSYVLVGLINNRPESAFVASVTELDKYYLYANDEIQIGGDNFKGLVKIDDLVDKLNQLENKVNDFIQKYNTHTHITTATESATPTPGTISPTMAQETPIQPITQVSDLENTKVKHGDNG